jgi:hypothetical protein
VSIVAGKSYLMGVGNSGTIQYPTQGQNPGNWTICRLTNASPFPVMLRIGGIYLDTLPAWTANIYPLLEPGQGQGVITSSPDRFTYQCVTPANLPSSTGGDSTLYTDFGLYGDTFPGSYPQPLAGQAVAAALSGAVLLENQAIGSWAFPGVGPSGASHDFTIPTNSHSVKIFVTAASLLTGTLTVTGDQSGFKYLSSIQLSQNLSVAIPFGDVGIDTSMTFTVRNTNIGGTIFVMGSSDPALIPITTLAGNPLLVEPWLGPMSSVAAQVNATTATVLTVPAGFAYRIWKVTFSQVGAGPTQSGVSDSTGNEYMNTFLENTTMKDDLLDLAPTGVVLTAGVSMSITAAAGVQARVSVWFSDA